ncbi:MAG: hypothetical protein RR303_03530 [Bacteroidales bacterium]
MMKQHKIILLAGWLLACACNMSRIDMQSDEVIGIVPDYCGITVPYNIAPLNFSVPGIENGFIQVEGKRAGRKVFKIWNGNVEFPVTAWKKLLEKEKGGKLKFTIATPSEHGFTGYAPFEIEIADEPIDPFLVYRLIEPGYELWGEMGIYQRSLENFREEALIENKSTAMNCMNCHSFCEREPEKMLFHMRADYSGTYVMKDEKYRKLNLKNCAGLKSLVYPAWHPQGRFIAFSTNDTKQGFHVNDRNRIEVYDRSSDIVLYDTHENRLFTTPLLYSKDRFETFPTFSPDGKSLYYCSAKARPMPDLYKEVHYDLCRIDFHPETGKTGQQADTIYKSEAQSSASFPRISPDGRYLLFTVSDYGNFSIWHKEADLKMIDLKSGKEVDLSAWNSRETESYHSWSSNGKWVVFSSRRMDGLYTRPFLGYMRADGSAGKAFVLPQKYTRYYDELMKSYNIPEFLTRPANLSAYQVTGDCEELLPDNLEVIH